MKDFIEILCNILEDLCKISKPSSTEFQRFTFDEFESFLWRLSEVLPEELWMLPLENFRGSLCSIWQIPSEIFRDSLLRILEESREGF